MYIGLLLLIFHWVLLMFTLFAMVILHVQILQKERYLPTVFGQRYISYQRRTSRNIGRKR